MVDYRLNTVTFGVSCAPFLALRVLKQLSADDGARFPRAAAILNSGLYVDDCLFGAHDNNTAREIRDELITLLKGGGFTLRKWASNKPDLLSDISPDDHGLAWEKPLSEDDGIKILGVVWNPTHDAYQFRINLIWPSSLTKRSLLSCISKLYDPLVWVSPVVITAKIFIQRLWLASVDWDTRLPADLCTQWTHFYESLSALENFTIPRWIGLGPDIVSCEFHGFSDASSVAYAAVGYLRVVHSDGHVQVSLLASRTKVAPVKQLTIPRLELLAAVLLARLTTLVQQIPQFSNLTVYCWADATIVLHWLGGHASKWKTFVANRVSEIQRSLPHVQWRHVSNADNPADLASRGISAHDLAHSRLWLMGPEWLSEKSEAWPNTTPLLGVGVELEERTRVAILTTQTSDTLDELASRASSWLRFIRVVAYVLRWKTHIDSQIVRGCLTYNEIHRAETAVYRWLQAVLFPTDLVNLQAQRTVSAKSKLRSLTPYIDDDGLIRVGGRLANSELPFSTKHPIILAAHPVVRLLTSYTHLTCLHGGVSVTLRTLRETVWALQAKKLIRSTIFHCVICIRLKAELSSQIMGNLPASRSTRPERPFFHCGVDYAGPYQVRVVSGRGHKSHPAWIALFVCFAVKAVHIELVFNYSSPAFLAAFKRFVSRRALPSCMYSDQGTTFVCADNELETTFHQAIADEAFRDLLAKDHVEWRFLPPAAPHFCGIWEAGVKSVKFHLNRVLMGHTPTFEELTTLLCEIEAVLNSLAPLSEDPEDLATPTPGHFLIGGPLTAVPERSILTLSVNRLSRWQQCRQMLEQFWRLWSSDYLLSLQQRIKWQIPNKPIASGQLVLLKKPNLPPMKWPLARVVDCSLGSDGIVRVVKLRTASSMYTRPITKIARLPVEISET